MAKKKSKCDKCERNRTCNTFDKARGMACKDYEKKKEKQHDSV